MKIEEWQGWGNRNGVWMKSEWSDSDLWPDMLLGWVYQDAGPMRWAHIVKDSAIVFEVFVYGIGPHPESPPKFTTLEDAANCALGMLDEWKRNNQ